MWWKFCKQLILILIYTGATFPAYKALRHPYMIAGHDADATVFKLMEFDQALADGHFPVRWSKRLNFGLGQPTFTFLYNAPYYVATVIRRMGFSYGGALKVLMGSGFVLGGYFAYLWLVRYFDQWSAFVGGVMYVYIPYHFLNVYTRFAVGEAMAATLLPLTFWAIDRGLDNPSKGNLGVWVLVCAGFILSHNFMALVFTGVWIVYALWRSRSRVGWVILGMMWGYAVDAYFVIPAVAYKGYTHLNTLSEWFTRHNNYVRIQDLISMGPTPGFGIGVVQEMLTLVGFSILGYQLSKRRFGLGEKMMIFFGVVFLWGVVMTLHVSQMVWDRLAILQSMQFPWRFLFVVRLVATFCGIYALSKVRFKWVGVAIIALLLLVNKGYWKADYYTFEDKTKTAIGWPGLLTLTVEETPLWHKKYEEANPYHPSNGETGEVVIKSIVWKTNYHMFYMLAKKISIINDRTNYWPGWEVHVDGQKVPLFDPYHAHSNGMLTFEINPGPHVVEAFLRETTLEKMGNIITVFALGMVALVQLPYRRLRVFKQRSST